MNSRLKNSANSILNTGLALQEMMAHSVYTEMINMEFKPRCTPSETSALANGVQGSDIGLLMEIAGILKHPINAMWRTWKKFVG
jgi:hypothetical protein